MTSINIYQLERGKEFANDWKSLIGDVFTSNTSNKECRLLKTHLLRILEWEIAKVVQCGGQDP
jgi:hypothetical protein